MGSKSQTLFVSLGSVFLDELRWPGKAPQKDVVGGSATYATLGARMFTAQDSARLALILQAGDDFPAQALELLSGWSITLLARHHPGQPSARGVLEHSAASGGARYTRTTTPLLSEPADLAEYGLLESRFIHLFGSAEIVDEQLKALSVLQRNLGIDPVGQQIVWEPHPKSCVEDLLADHITVLRSGRITVFSPNHIELGTFFSESYAAFDRSAVEDQAAYIWTAVQGNTPRSGPRLQALIIRAAQHGCLVLTGDISNAVWLPAFWSQSQQERVIDPTGAGNSFLGGLTQGWMNTDSWLRAACYGSVAASIVVENVGPPSLLVAGTLETWSGVSPQQRVAEFLAREDVRALIARYPQL